MPVRTSPSRKRIGLGVVSAQPKPPITKNDPIIVPLTDNRKAAVALHFAHRRFEMLKSGAAPTMGALARAEKVQRTYITALLPLPLLAPFLRAANR